MERRLHNRGTFFSTFPYSLILISLYLVGNLTFSFSLYVRFLFLINYRLKCESDFASRQWTKNIGERAGAQ